MRLNNNFRIRTRCRQERFLTERQFQALAGHISEDGMAKLDAIYAKFEALEEELARCYFLLQEKFITNPRLARFWAEAALDELQHASILRYCRQQQLFEMEPVDRGAAERVDDLLDTVKSIVSNHGVTVDDAFYAALLIESSELDDTFRKLTRPLAKNHTLLYETIRDNFQSHHDKFAEAAAEFTNDRAYVEAFRAFARGGYPERCGKDC
jgi:hypothetical protein